MGSSLTRLACPSDMPHLSLSSSLPSNVNRCPGLILHMLWFWSISPKDLSVVLVKKEFRNQYLSVWSVHCNWDLLLLGLPVHRTWKYTCVNLYTPVPYIFLNYMFLSAHMKMMVPPVPIDAAGSMLVSPFPSLPLILLQREA